MDNSKKIIDPQRAYNEEYYKNYTGQDYEKFIEFLGNVADWIVKEIKPRTVMDVGCAKGILVGALRDRGVEAYGLDVSEYAISQVREDIKPYCRVGLATDPLDREFDLVTCIEVMEHLTDQDGRLCIKHLAEKAKTIFFSSSPNEFTEATHINVHPIQYWAEIFLGHGFYPDLALVYEPIPQALVLKRKAPQIEEVVLLFSNYLMGKIEFNIAMHQKNLLINELGRQLELERQGLLKRFLRLLVRFYQILLGEGFFALLRKVKNKIFIAKK